MWSNSEMRSGHATYLILLSMISVALLGCRATPPSATETKIVYWTKRNITIGGRKDVNPVPARPENIEDGKQIFTKLVQEYKPRGFEAVDVAFNTMANIYVNDFVRDYKIGYPVEGIENLYVMPSGTDPQIDEAILRNPRWTKLAEGFSEATSLLLLVTAGDSPGLSDLIDNVFTHNLEYIGAMTWSDRLQFCSETLTGR